MTLAPYLSPLYRDPRSERARIVIGVAAARADFDPTSGRVIPRRLSATFTVEPAAHWRAIRVPSGRAMLRADIPAAVFADAISAAEPLWGSRTFVWISQSAAPPRVPTIATQLDGTLEYLSTNAEPYLCFRCPSIEYDVRRVCEFRPKLPSEDDWAAVSLALRSRMPEIATAYADFHLGPQVLPEITDIVDWPASP